jgi:hypothetical protein
MKFIRLIILPLAALLSCNSRQSVPAQESDFIITFKLTADDILPGISIDKPETENLMDADAIVLPFDRATLTIDYPLNRSVTFQLTGTAQGFSRKQLIRAISEKYHLIYEEEERTATVKTIPLNEREGTVNRNQTNGKYGIWGHDLSDLVLTAIDVHKNTRGEITLTLQVES